MQAAANDHEKLKKLLQGFDPWVKHGAAEGYGSGLCASRKMRAVEAFAGA
jgi:hypothetical protein